jgi:hypothetical protein
VAEQPAKKSVLFLYVVLFCQLTPLFSKAKSAGGGGKKKLSAFNKFMQTELARLKEMEPNVAHKDRSMMSMLSLTRPQRLTAIRTIAGSSRRRRTGRLPKRIPRNLNFTYQLTLVRSLIRTEVIHSRLIIH